MIIYAGDLRAVALTNLFNMCISHGYVPNNFCESITVRVNKDKNGKSNAYENNRPISLVTMFSTIFEFCISARIVFLLSGRITGGARGGGA